MIPQLQPFMAQFGKGSFLYGPVAAEALPFRRAPHYSEAGLPQAVDISA
jgi:hypothetical protein